MTEESPPLKLYSQPEQERREYIGQAEAYRRFAALLEAERLKIAEGTERRSRGR